MTLSRDRLESIADGYIDMRVPNYTISGIDTEYVDFCFSWQDLIDLGLPNVDKITLVGADVLYGQESLGFVHHAAVYGSEKESESRTCMEELDYTYILYDWAPGNEPFILPSNVGYNLGREASGTPQSFRMNVHYDNPRLVEGVVDDSGLRVYYSFTEREHQLGIAMFGDPLVAMEGTIIENGLTNWDFDCSTDCSEIAMTEKVTVIRTLRKFGRRQY